MFMNLKGIKFCIKFKNWTIIVFISTLKTHGSKHGWGTKKDCFILYIVDPLTKNML
jgi:hypothetical protein